MSGEVTTRDQLLRLLAEAAELEHGIACSYLYAAFALKRELAEGGMSWPEQQAVRRWAAQIYFIASQEMLHLALVWNMTTAIGGRPSPLRPNFPQSSSYYPLHLPIELEAFGDSSLRRFIGYEHPTEPLPERRPYLSALEDSSGQLVFGTIGKLYELIRGGFEFIPANQLFIGKKTQQVGPKTAHFPDLVEVTGRAQAITAIERILHQGEGVAKDRDDSHFGAFVAILEEYDRLRAQGSGFAPAREALRNPVLPDETGAGPGGRTITDPLTQRAARLFDDIYALMICMLAWSFEADFASAGTQVSALCNFAIELMPRVLLPLGEALMKMPAGSGFMAGPTFALSRPLLLPFDPANAQRLCGERLAGLAEEAGELVQAAPALPFAAIARWLAEGASRLNS